MAVLHFFAVLWTQVEVRRREMQPISCHKNFRTYHLYPKKSTWEWLHIYLIWLNTFMGERGRGEKWKDHDVYSHDLKTLVYIFLSVGRVAIRCACLFVLHAEKMQTIPLLPPDVKGCSCLLCGTGRCNDWLELFIVERAQHKEINTKYDSLRTSAEAVVCPWPVEGWGECLDKTVRRLVLKVISGHL